MSFASIRRRIEASISDRLDDLVLQWLLRAMVAAAVVVLALDYGQLAWREPDPLPAPLPVHPADSPELTTAAPDGLPFVRRDHDRQGRPTDARLTAAMSFDLLADGRLAATGTIRPGTAGIFAAEIEKRGAYVKTILLHSPGGSVADALEMGRLIRQHQFATEVDSDSLCASSCPLMFAGGTERLAGARAAIGVHQVTALAVNGSVPTLAKGMESVQRIAADCEKYLVGMGIDPLVWVHAMETPADGLYYFKSDELLKLKLATQTIGTSQARDLKANLPKPEPRPAAHAKSERT